MTHYSEAFSTNFSNKEKFGDSFSTIKLECIFELLYSQSVSCRHPNFFAEIYSSNFYLLIFILGWKLSRRQSHQIRMNHRIVPFKINLIPYLLPTFLPFPLQKKIGVRSKSHDISKSESDEAVSVS